jgi:hypothetical protein
VRHANSFTDNEQRKASGVPTLMITVKNEMAQSVDEQTIPTTGMSTRFNFASHRLSITLDPTETATLRHIFSDAVYFLIKSGNEENISLAKAKVSPPCLSMCCASS